MMTRFNVDMIDTDKLAKRGLSIESVNEAGEVMALRDEIIRGRIVTARDELFARVLRSCTRINGAGVDNSGEAPC